MFHQSELFRSLLPVIAGSCLTMAGTVVSLNFSTGTQQQAQLRAAYSTFLSAADEANESTVGHYRDEVSVFSKYLLRRRFRVGHLLQSDSAALEDAGRRAKEQVSKLRKTSFDLLLLEPSASHREQVRTYVSHFLDAKIKLDRAAGRVRTFIETGTYNPDGEGPAATARGQDDVMGAFYETLNTTRTTQNDEYTKLVNDVLEDDRWH